MNNKEKLISIGIDEETINQLFKSYNEERKDIFTRDCLMLYNAGYKGYLTWVISSWGSKYVSLELDFMKYKKEKSDE